MVPGLVGKGPITRTSGEVRRRLALVSKKSRRRRFGSGGHTVFDPLGVVVDAFVIERKASCMPNQSPSISLRRVHRLFHGLIDHALPSWAGRSYKIILDMMSVGFATAKSSRMKSAVWDGVPSFYEESRSLGNHNGSVGR